MAQRKGTPLVVNVLPVLSSKTFKVGEEETLLTCQYRPPMKAYVMELPAAIVNDGETVDEAALRTVLSETGYVGTVRSRSAPTSSSAGFCNERVAVVVVDVNLDDYTSEEFVTKRVGKKWRRGMLKTIKVSGESWIPQQSLKDDQIIEIKRIKLRELQRHVDAAGREGVVSSVSVQAVAIGLAIAGVGTLPMPPPAAKKGWW